MLLEVDSKTREDDGYLASMYLYHYYNGTPHEFILDNVSITLVKTRQRLQNKYPHLQASKEVREKRQKHCIAFKQEYRKQRSQEKPEWTVAEDVSYKFQKETTWQSVKRFFSI
jgi:hypothetical protein